MSAKKNFVIDKSTVGPAKSAPAAARQPVSGVVAFNAHPGAAGRAAAVAPVSAAVPRSLPPKSIQGPISSVGVGLHAVHPSIPPVSINNLSRLSHSQMAEVPVTSISAIQRLPQDNSRWLWIAIVVLCSVVTLLLTRLWYEQKLHKTEEHVAKIKASLVEKSSALKQARQAAKDTNLRADTGRQAGAATPAAPIVAGAAVLPAGAPSVPATVAKSSGAGVGTLPIAFEDIETQQEAGLVHIAFTAHNKGAELLDASIFVVLRFNQKDGKPLFIYYPEQMKELTNGVPKNIAMGHKVKMQSLLEKYLKIPVPATAGSLEGALLIAVDSKGRIKQQVVPLGT